MTENKVIETTQDLIQSLSESNRAVMESAVAAQERNVKFAQSVLENGIEVLKSHAEGTRTLMQDVSQKPQKVFPLIADRAVAVQERNIQFAEGMLENGIEVLKSHAESTSSLMHTLFEQSRKQQEVFGTLAQASVEAYMKLLFAPLSYFERAFEVMGTTTREGAESFQKVAP